jgi:hypothetical protein
MLVSYVKIGIVHRVSDENKYIFTKLRSRKKQSILLFIQWYI